MRNETTVQNIKDCGQSLIDNAENIAGHYKYLQSLIITCYVDDPREAPFISISTDFCPERFIERNYNG